MSSLKRSILVLALALVASTAATADWLHFADAIVQATDDVEKHPGKISHVIPVTKAMEAPLACVGYTNSVSQKSRGRLITDVLVVKADGTEETKKLIGGVKKNAYLNCKKLDADLATGDVVFFDTDLRNFSRLRNDDSRSDFAEISAMLSATGEPELAQDAPLGFVPEKVAPFGLLPSPGAGWYYAARSVFQVDDDKLSQKHPTALDRTLMVGNELKKSEVCISYSQMSAGDGGGRVIGTAKIIRPDESVESLKIVAPVKGGTALTCKAPAKKIDAGSIVEFSMELKGMARLENDGESIAFADITAAISTTGEPIFREPPPPPMPDPPPAPVATPTNPSPTPTAPAPPPGSTGALSAEDQACISRVLYAAGGGARQIVRPRGNKGGKFEVFGPNSVIGSDGKPVVSTLGFGSTYAAACADYERKRGKMSAGPSVPSADISLWVWFSNMNSSGGPTAVRRDPRGGYHGDCWRPGKGVVIFSGSSVNSVMKKLQGAGL